MSRPRDCAKQQVVRPSGAPAGPYRNSYTDAVARKVLDVDVLGDLGEVFFGFGRESATAPRATARAYARAGDPTREHLLLVPI